MLNSRARRLLAGPLGHVAALLEKPAITPNRITMLGLVLVSRVVDGLYGDVGGFLDMTVDFVVYGSFVVGVGLGTQGTPLRSCW